MTSRNCLLTSEELDWYNEGIVLLMNVMKGRAVERTSAEYQIYEQWRGKHHLKTMEGNHGGSITRSQQRQQP